MVPVRIVIADDHEVWRSGLRVELGEGFDVVGTAATAPEAVEVIRETRADVVACDLNMPGGGGIAVVEACAKEVPIVIVTVSEDERDLLDAVAAGAVGYLVKTTAAAALRESLGKAAMGEPVFSPGLASLVLGEFRRLGKAVAGKALLTDRERQVLQLVAQGYTYVEIAAALFISPKTSENHVRNIMAKLHFNRREQLIRFAIEHGIR